MLVMKVNMEELKKEIIEDYFASEILQLNFKRLIINKAVRKFNINKNEAKTYYTSIKSVVRKEALNKAFIYLLLGSVSLFVGIMGTFGNSEYIFWGALLTGAGMNLASFGLFSVYLTSNNNNNIN